VVTEDIFYEKGGNKYFGYEVIHAKDTTIKNMIKVRMVFALLYQSVVYLKW